MASPRNRQMSEKHHQVQDLAIQFRKHTHYLPFFICPNVRRNQKGHLSFAKEKNDSYGFS